MDGTRAQLDSRNFTKLYLNGEFTPVKSNETYSLKNPKDNSLVVDGVAIAGEEDVEIAVRNAEAAFTGPWSSFTSLQRTDCFVKLAQLLEERLLSILTLDSLSSGSPTMFAHNRDKNYIINTVKYYAGWTDKFKGEYLPADDGNHDPDDLQNSADCIQVLSNWFKTSHWVSAQQSIHSTHPLERSS